MNDSDSRALPPQPTSLCMRYQPLLALLRTDALSPREATMLTEHLSGCLWCQRELATYDALDAAARQYLSALTFTPLTLEDIMPTTQTTHPPTQTPAANDAPTTARSEVRRTARTQPSGRPPLSALAPLAAVITLTLLAGLIFMTHGSSPTPGSGTPIPTISTATLPTVSQPSAALAQSTWTLTQLIVDGHEQLLAPSHAPTLHFQLQDDRSGVIQGTGGCNAYSGSYTLTDILTSSMSISVSAITQVGCQSIVSMPENAYLQALPRVDRYYLQGDTLTLGSVNGSVRLTFHATH